MNKKRSILMLSRRKAIQVLSITGVALTGNSTSTTNETAGSWLRSALPSDIVSDLLLEGRDAVERELLHSLPERSKADFIAERIIHVDGWMLSRAECTYHLVVEERMT